MTDYYRNNYRQYFESTIDIDPSSFLEPFVKILQRGSSVLDIGCGSGRDLLWMSSRGYQPTGFERSPGLARLAREASGCVVIEGDFETFDFSHLSMDAILLITALVHIPHDRLRSVIANIANALKPDGLVLLSLKGGFGTTTDRKGRTFYLWQKSELINLLQDLDFRVVETTVNLSTLNTGESIINMLLQGPRESAET